MNQNLTKGPVGPRANVQMSDDLFGGHVFLCNWPQQPCTL